MNSKGVIRGQILVCLIGLCLSFLTVIFAGMFHMTYILFAGALFIALFSRGLLDAYRDYKVLKLVEEVKKDV